MGTYGSPASRRSSSPALAPAPLAAPVATPTTSTSPGLAAVRITNGPTSALPYATVSADARRPIPSTAAAYPSVHGRAVAGRSSAGGTATRKARAAVAAAAASLDPVTGSGSTSPTMTGANGGDAQPNWGQPGAANALGLDSADAAASGAAGAADGLTLPMSADTLATGGAIAAGVPGGYASLNTDTQASCPFPVHAHFNLARSALLTLGRAVSSSKRIAADWGTPMAQTQLLVPVRGCLTPWRGPLSACEQRC